MTLLGRVSLIGLSLLALFSTWRTAPAYVGIAMCVPAMLASIWDQRRKGPDAITLVVIALALWLTGRYALQAWAGIGTAGLGNPEDDVRSWLYILLFAPLAALPVQNPMHRVRMLWLLAMTGFALGVGTFLFEHGLDVLWSGRRLGFHLNRPLGAGLYAGCFALALLFTLRNWWRRKEGGTPWLKRIAGIGLIVLFAQVMISAQNRSTFLAAMSVLVFSAGFIAMRRLRRSRTSGAKIATLAASFVAVLVFGLMASSLDVIKKRSAIDQNAISAMMIDGLEEAPISSATIRLRLWQFSIEQFADAPLIGHGFGSLTAVIDRELRPLGGLAKGERYDHVHNGFLQMLWTQGLVGCVLWSTLLGILVRDALRAAKQHPERRALIPAMWALLAFAAIWSFFDFRLPHPDMRFFTILMLLSLRLLGRPDDASQNVLAENRHP